MLVVRARASLPGDGREQQVALRALARLVFTHAFAEEAVSARRHAAGRTRLARSRSCVQGQRIPFGWQWQLLRWTFPTRPHPTVSRRPPGQVLSALPLTVLYRARDRLQQLDEATDRRFARACADRRLADAAGWVERLPLLQRGERPQTHGGPSGDAPR